MLIVHISPCGALLAQRVSRSATVAPLKYLVISSRSSFGGIAPTGLDRGLSDPVLYPALRRARPDLLSLLVPTLTFVIHCLPSRHVFSSNSDDIPSRLDHWDDSLRSRPSNLLVSDSRYLPFSSLALSDPLTPLHLSLSPFPSLSPPLSFPIPPPPAAICSIAVETVDPGQTLISATISFPSRVPPTLPLPLPKDYF